MLSQKQYSTICTICHLDTLTLPNEESLSLVKLMHRHFVDFHPENLIKCLKFPECDLTFSQHRLMQLHYKSFHLKEKKFQCNYCPKIYPCVKSYRWHMDTLHQEYTDEPYSVPCKEDGCDAVFSCQQNLNMHTRVTHRPNPKIRLEQCFFCPEKVRNLKKHVISAHEKPGAVFPCEFCEGLLFATRFELNEHGKRDHHFFPVSAVPGSKSATKNGVSRPRDPLNCLYCDKVFFAVGRFGMHVRGVHNKVRFPCPLCDRSYFSKNDMKTHIRSVHGGEKIKCRVEGCARMFGRKPDRNRHERDAHNRSFAD